MKIVIAGAGEVGGDQESGLVRKCYSRGDYQCDGLYVGS